MTRRGRYSVPASAVVILAVALVGCASALRSADRDLAAGRYAEAAAGYETVLDRHPGTGEERALFRLGLAASLADPTGVSPRGAAALHRLLGRYPTSRYRAQAELVLRLNDTLQRARERASAREASGEELQKKLAACGEELARVRRELEQLKRIDLQRPH